MFEILNENELEQVSGGAGQKNCENYKIKDGETLAVIAASRGTTVSVLMNLNPQIKNPASIRAGQNILVPKK